MSGMKLMPTESRRAGADDDDGRMSECRLDAAAGVFAPPASKIMVSGLNLKLPALNGKGPYCN